MTRVSPAYYRWDKAPEPVGPTETSRAVYEVLAELFRQNPIHSMKAVPRLSQPQRSQQRARTYKANMIIQARYKAFELARKGNILAALDYARNYCGLPAQHVDALKALLDE